LLYFVNLISGVKLYSVYFNFILMSGIFEIFLRNVIVVLEITLGVIYTLVGDEDFRFKLKILFLQLGLFGLIILNFSFSAFLILPLFIFTKDFVKRVVEI